MYEPRRQAIEIGGSFPFFSNSCAFDSMPTNPAFRNISRYKLFFFVPGDICFLLLPTHVILCSRSWTRCVGALLYIGHTLPVSHERMGTRGSCRLHPSLLGGIPLQRFNWFHCAQLAQVLPTYWTWWRASEVPDLLKVLLTWHFERGEVTWGDFDVLETFLCSVGVGVLLRFHFRSSVRLSQFKALPIT